jgi:hypothetical protein
MAQLEGAETQVINITMNPGKKLLTEPSTIIYMSDGVEMNTGTGDGGGFGWWMTGNHEADIEHCTVCHHVRNFPGKWINSNMLNQEAIDCQQEYNVIELNSPDGSNKKKVSLCAVLSDDPDLYSHFEEPGALATIANP